MHPRPQTSTENCTWHNFNVVPTTNGRKILVSGNYQSGISVLDFTNPAGVSEIAYADPAPLINPANPAAIESGGDWSTYWYDGYVYESDMTRGLPVWRLNDPAVASARGESHSNPQTQYASLSGAPAGGKRRWVGSDDAVAHERRARELRSFHARRGPRLLREHGGQRDLERR